MNCPHCRRPIPEQKIYLMAKRTPRDEPLTDRARRIAWVGGIIIPALVLGELLHLVGA